MNNDFNKIFNEWLWSDDPEVKKENPFIKYISGDYKKDLNLDKNDNENKKRNK